MKKTAAVAGVITGAMVLTGASAAALAAAPEATVAPVEAAAAQEAEAFSPFVRVANVQGTFAASQDVLSTVDEIAGMFRKASAAMCASLPNYDVTAVQAPIAVTGDVENPFDATVTQMVEEQGGQSYILACACASNVPGGGAIANAQVEGISLAAIAAVARA